MNVRTRRVCDDFEPTVTFRITKIDETHFATTSNDNFLRVWELPQMLIIKHASLMRYIYGLDYEASSKVFYVGNGIGILQVVNAELEVIKQKQFHNDLISQAILHQDKLITASIDYTVKISNKESLEVTRSFDFQEPIWNVRVIEQDIYVLLSQNPSVRIEDWQKQTPLKWSLKNIIELGKTDQKVKIGNSPSFNQLINLETGQSTNTKCQTIVPYKGELLIIDEGVLSLRSKIGTRVFKFPEIENSTILDAKEIGEFVIVGLDNGRVMTLQVET